MHELSKQIPLRFPDETTINALLLKEVCFQSKKALRVQLPNNTNLCLVARKPTCKPEAGETQSQAYYNKWQMLKDAGLPVLSPLIRISDHEVAVPDLSYHGITVYGKIEAQEIAEEDHFILVGREKPNNNLLRMDISEFTRRVDELTQMATKAQIILPEDPFHLLIFPDGSWDIVMLDFEDVRRANNPDETQRNFGANQYFKSWILSIYYFLKRELVLHETSYSTNEFYASSSSKKAFNPLEDLALLVYAQITGVNNFPDK